MTDMTDKAINRLRYNKSVAPQKPVLLYFAPGAARARITPRRRGERNSRASSTRAGTLYDRRRMNGN
jgi:hypothetical protein